jgi:beta-lactamase regulating signal transducer with metallopeptidase domain
MALPSIQECAAVLDPLAPFLLRAVIGSAAVIGLAALATLAMRRSSAAARHGAWLLGFIGALLLPVLSAALPGWHVLPRAAPIQPNQTASVISPIEQELAITPSPELTPPPVESAPPPSAPAPLRQDTIADTSEASRAAARPPLSVAMKTTGIKLASNSPIGPHLESKPAPHSQHLPWIAWLVLCWALGSLLALARVLLGHLSLWWLQRRCSTLSAGSLFDLLQRLCTDLQIDRPVELLCTPLRSMPMTWGLWRPRLLLPEQAADWPENQRRDVLLHELGHVLRRDCLTQFLSQVACALYWFNPLAWVAARRMQVERERACDDLVLNSGVDAPSYARHLLASVSDWSMPTFGLAGAAVAMARPSTLEERMQAILDARLSRRRPGAYARIAMALLLLAALVPVAILKAQTSAAQERSSRGGSQDPTQGHPDASPQAPTTRPAPQGEISGSGFSGGRGGGVGDPTTPVLGEGPTCPLDATLYSIRLPLDKITKLDVAALQASAATPASFEKALAALGGAKPLYRADQSVRLSGDTIRIGSHTPYVSNTMMTSSGKSIDHVSYMGTGATFSLAGKTAARGGIDLDLNIEVSSFSDSPVSIDNKGERFQPIIYTFNLEHKGRVPPGQPFVVATVDAVSVDKDGNAAAFIAIVRVGEPQSPAAK